MYDAPRFLPAGDQALVVELGDEIDPDVNRRVRDLAHSIETQAVLGVVDLVPTYRSLLVEYDARRTSLSDLQQELSELAGATKRPSLPAARVVHVPTLYGGDYGPDLMDLAERTGLVADEVVQLHSSVEYLVYMMGFTPGFPYLGGLDESLSVPRLQSPRQQVPAGSVGIAESQTGVYPVESPGGWRIIGRTPLELFDAMREPPSLLSAGDYILFTPLADESEFLKVRDQIESGAYVLTTTAKNDLPHS